MNKFLQRFSVYDLVIIAIMAALGIAVKPIVVPLAHLISGPLMMPSGAFAGGLYMMWLVIAYGIVKKPGTPTLTALIQALLVFLTGIVGSHGIMTFFTYLIPGISIDLVLLLIGHRVCCRGCAVVSGVVANVAGTVCVNLVFFQAPDIYLILIMSVAALSGTVGGLLAWQLLRVMEKYKLIAKFQKKGMANR
ncbi:MAG: ECF transporter S component [Anaerovoracaceae bacterium]